jgi:hypothetical protein
VKKPTDPAKSPNDVTDKTTGLIDQAKFKKLVERWPGLPPAEQARALNDLTNGMSQRHAEAIRNYFRNLNDPAFNRK